MSTRRPEEYAPPEVFYNDTGAAKYLRSSRMVEIQTKLSMRCIEMLCLPPDQSCLLLDIGCGAGLSGSALEEMGHRFVGTDISRPMILAARDRVDGDMMEHDMGTGLPFRPGVFDGAISVSALQWLCCAHRKDHLPHKRLKLFFTSLYKVLRRGARAVLQFYPGNRHQASMIVQFATRAGFSGGLVVDYPHSTRAKKYYLVLMSGPQAAFQTPAAREGDGEDLEGGDEDMDGDDDDEEEEEDEEDDGADARTVASTVACNPRKRKVQMTAREKRGREKLYRTRSGRPQKGSKEWIERKKEQQERKGMEVRKTTKYTGRRRKPKF
eukprot:TRINITY_DN47012_c0_g1_i1.p2 TRINITY_DN47012_c0_g1~~TRINITY_DN47012_c0_g1_i1.p2  ORF type:complete len:348 (+),score=146.53 TRINITY_DN47012_c0_g1_i1:73-1044(+)